MNQPLTERHLRAAGRRLWQTGGYSREQVQAYCDENGLTAEQAAHVLAGWEKDATKREYAVTVDYRTHSGQCNSTMILIKATDASAAVDAACDKVRKRKSVAKIDGGSCQESRT